MPETTQRFKKANSSNHATFALAQAKRNKVKKILELTGDESKDPFRLRVRARANGTFDFVQYERIGCHVHTVTDGKSCCDEKPVKKTKAKKSKS